MLKGFEEQNHAELYAKYRLIYPDDVAHKAIAYAQENMQGGEISHMVDVGCGNGQSTELYKNHVEKITAIDTSESQIAEAKKNPASNITYSVATAENLPVDRDSVDLICSGQAIHWVDFPKFWNESRRVLKSNGSIVLYGYDLFHVIPEQVPANLEKSVLKEKAAELLLQLRHKCKFHERINHVDNRYVEIFDLIPSTKKHRDDTIFIDRHWTLLDVKHFLSTWSGYQTYLREKESGDPDILRQYLDELKKLYGLQSTNDEDIKLHITWNVFMIFANRPS